MAPAPATGQRAGGAGELAHQHALTQLGDALAVALMAASMPAIL
jgi:hypothetical protein